MHDFDMKSIILQNRGKFLLGSLEIIGAEAIFEFSVWLLVLSDRGRRLRLKTVSVP